MRPSVFWFCVRMRIRRFFAKGLAGLEWAAFLFIMLLLAVLAFLACSKEWLDAEEEDEETVGEMIGELPASVAKTELEPEQLSWLANAIAVGDEAGGEFVRWADELAEEEEIQRAIALASKQGAN